MRAPGPKGRLRAAIEGDELVIRISTDILCFAIEQGDGINPGVRITDRGAFTKWFAGELIEFGADETGCSAIERVFDQLAVDAVEGAQPFVAEPVEP